jgi:hypothetical protein
VAAVPSGLSPTPLIIEKHIIKWVPVALFYYAASLNSL